MKLVVLAGAKKGTEIPLKRDKFVIGRASDCTLRAGSEAISRHHCALLRSEKGLQVRDLGSRNGTHVNGEKITGPTMLNHGDTLRVGTLEFRIEAAHDLNRQKKPKVQGVADAVSRSAGSGNAQGGETIEEDISRWLLGPDPEETNTANRETQSFKMDETHTLAEVSKPHHPPDGDKPAGEGDSQSANTKNAEEAKSGDKNKKTYGKLPPIPKKAPKDSREAAADVLREMTRRR